MKKEIQSTKDYDVFKKLLGNRPVTPTRVNKIVKSIKKIGYMSNPIIVNEKMEVIDGQGRLEALKILGLPVEYIIQKGVGIDECMQMNINQTNWALLNYINAYAERKNENYMKLQKLIRQYNEFSINSIATALYGINKFYPPILTSGELVISDESLEIAKQRLDYVRNFNETIAKMKVNRSVLRQALLYISMFDDVDKESFIGQFNNNGLLLKPFHTIKDCMQALEELYNYKRQKKVYIYTRYDTIARQNNRRGIERIMRDDLYNKKQSTEKIIESKEQLSNALKEAFNNEK